ncbi:hypothetical protein D2E26_0480 [Bifidobacterium dolichotidis]|uniref:Lipoprotein n=1 Tax=Bifidobacterium dolichotidis TaxID=2306976 RepID=A0A430FSX1_9BIFI|nr:hypothetical protein [Bifidobacterium dolichotidis]RSX55917.1 hypothetical protein D2E26_0480 [Bifidobacterium dolichotidis]
MKKLLPHAVTLCVFALCFTLAGCGSPSNSSSPEPSETTTSDVSESSSPSSSAADGPAEVGHGPVALHMTVPDGFTPNSDGGYSDANYKVSIWPGDTSIYENEADFQEALAKYSDTKSAGTTPYTVTMVTDAESWYGPNTTYYFVNFNGAIDGVYGCKIMVAYTSATEPDAAALAATQAPEISQAMETIVAA